MGSVNSGRPVSQHLEFGGPDAAEHGDELRAGTEVVTAITGPDVGGGVGGVVGCTDDWKERKYLVRVLIKCPIIVNVR